MAGSQTKNINDHPYPGSGLSPWTLSQQQSHLIPPCPDQDILQAIPIDIPYGNSPAPTMGQLWNNFLGHIPEIPLSIVGIGMKLHWGKWWNLNGTDQEVEIPVPVKIHGGRGIGRKSMIGHTVGHILEICIPIIDQ